MNTYSERKIANAIGGKTARACDSCLRKRARWFCSADDAFLCQACDALVHSANLLASRHERVRLETSSLKGTINEPNSFIPFWHQGFRKARTPRQPKHMKLQTPVNHPLPLVPEINGDETSLFEENDEQLLYRVPVFDPIADDFLGGDRIENIMLENEEAYHDLDLDKFLKGGDELEVFATDVGSLLGMGIEDDSPCRTNNLRMGALECEREESEVEELLYRVKVKVKEEEDGEDEEVQAAIACHFDPSLDMEFNWEFNYASSMSTVEDEDEMKTIGGENKTTVNIRSESGSKVERKMLRLNYEAVIAAWSTQGSPWTNGIRPQFDLDKFSVAYLGGSHQYGGDGGRSSVDDAGRQARVSRYREKRRTRLFAKKIRYEVRKLNAEKRPRIKGRFVKRTSLSASSSLPNYFMNK